MHPARFYTLLQFLIRFGECLAVGIYIPFLYHLGLSKAEIFFINAVYWLTIFATEVATGALADGKSRAWSVRLGLFLCAASSLVYPFAGHVHLKWFIMSVALTAEIIEGVGNSFISGALEAWLADALGRRGEKQNLKRAYASAGYWGSLGALCGGSASFGLLYLGFNVGWLTRTAFILVALAVAFKWMNGEGEPLRRMTEMQALRASCRLLLTNRMLIWITAVSMLFGLVLTFNLTWVPHFAQQSVGLSIGVWIACTLGLAAGGKVVERWKTLREREVASIVAANLLAGTGLAALGLCSGIALPILFVLLHEMGRGMLYPLIDGSIYNRVDSSYKATFGSLHSMLSRLGFGIVLFIGWLLMKGERSETSDSRIWLFSGLTLICAASIAWLLRPKDETCQAL